MNPQKIVRLEVENIKKLKALTIRPDGNVVVIAGANGSGKSSTLDSIAMAFAGKDAMPEVPVRRGEESAYTEVQTNDYVIRRTITAGGGGTLTVKSADGSARFSSPQALLDKIVGDLAFDPLAFTRMKPADQLATLRKLVGLDFTGIDARRRECFDRRTAVNRSVTELRAQLAGKVPHKGVPESEISLAELRDKHAAAQAENARNAEIRLAFANRQATVQAKKERRAAIETNIADLEEQLKALRLKSATIASEILEWEAAVAEDRPRVEALADADLSSIVAEMGEADDTNRKVRENQEIARRQKSLNDWTDDAAALTAQLADIDKEKEAALANAAFPVPGLSFNDAGIMLNGIPFEQASTAEQIRVSVAMGMAINPVLRVMFVRDASLLDPASMKLVCGMAAEHDYQLWIETVTTDMPAAIVIEDGAVKGAEAPGPVGAAA